MRPLLAKDLPTAALSKLGRYEVLIEIASGGMATVYLARALGAGGFERVVAVKCCHPHLRADEEFVKMFLDEARLAAKIHHPNVVPVLDVCNDDALYLVMEYIEGDRLSGLLKSAQTQKQQLPLRCTIRIAVEALRGLQAAHELCDRDGKSLNLVHRDVSPQNLLVGVDGSSRITDFGIAKAAESSSVTREGRLKGKLAYMAPEQLRGEPADARSDQYAMAVVLWEALTGVRLFPGNGDIAVMNAVLAGVVAPPSTHNPEVPPALDALVLKALAANPSARFSSAEAFADAIEECVRPASSREVSTLVRTLAGEEIARRAEALRQASTQHTVVPETKAIETVVAPAHEDEPITTIATNGTGWTAPAQPLPTAPRSDPRTALAGISLVVLVLAAIVGASMRTTTRTAAPSPTAPSATITQPAAPPIAAVIASPPAQPATPLIAVAHNTNDAGARRPHPESPRPHRPGVSRPPPPVPSAPPVAQPSQPRSTSSAPSTTELGPED